MTKGLLKNNPKMGFWVYTVSRGGAEPPPWTLPLALRASD